MLGVCKIVTCPFIAEQGVLLVIFQIELLAHPPKSPDINPIENIWGLMVQELSDELRRSTRHRGPDDLWEKVSEKFETLRRRQGLLHPTSELNAWQASRGY